VLRGIFADVCSDVHATLVQMDGEDDHVHLLVEYPPKVAVSSLVNSLKGVSSRLQPPAAPRHLQALLERRALVAQRLRFLLRRSAQQHRAPIHRATEDAELTFTTVSLSALAFPALEDGLAARPGQASNRRSETPAAAASGPMMTCTQLGAARAMPRIPREAIAG
jgi:REP element-mobilizing transposase RayT